MFYLPTRSFLVFSQRVLALGMPNKNKNNTLHNLYAMLLDHHVPVRFVQFLRTGHAARCTFWSTSTHTSRHATNWSKIQYQVSYTHGKHSTQRFCRAKSSTNFANFVFEYIHLARRSRDTKSLFRCGITLYFEMITLPFH